MLKIGEIEQGKMMNRYEELQKKIRRWQYENGKWMRKKKNRKEQDNEKEYEGKKWEDEKKMRTKRKKETGKRSSHNIVKIATESSIGKQVNTVKLVVF